MRNERPRALGVLSCCICAAGALLCAQTSAQVPPPPRSAHPESKSVGDTVHLKGGSALEGVQVLRVGTFAVEIQTLSGLAPLALPRSQVVSIEYDDVDPSHAPTVQNTVQAAPKPTVVPGTKLSKEFDQKLFAPLPEAALHILEQDFVALLSKLSADLAIPIEIKDEIKSMPAEMRVWSVEITPGASFITLLEVLAKEWPQLKFVFHSEGIVIAMKDEIKALPNP